MAESQDDRSVDEIIARIRSDLAALEAAQRKDVADESDDESGEQPKTLKGAEKESLKRLRAAKNQPNQG